MSEENSIETKNEMIYEIGGEEIKLSPSIVAQYITKGDGQISMTEAVNFMQFCKYAGLNPFLDEAYLIKYSNDRPAQTVTSKAAFMKRAHRQPQFNGFEAGIIVLDGNGELIERVGQFYNKASEKLLGGWARVHRKDIDYPFEIQVALEEYNTHKSMWAKMPANMIRKVALSAALRETFPEALSAMYSEDEPNVNELEESVKTSEKTEKTTESILADFKKTEDDEAAGSDAPDESASEPVDVEFEEVEEVEEVEGIDQTPMTEDEAAEQGGLFEGLTLNPKED